MYREDIIRIAKNNNIDIIFLKIFKKTINMEIYEKDRGKTKEFLREIKENNTYNNEVISYMNLYNSGLDRDVRGNTLEGSKALYLVDNEYYRSIVKQPTTKQLCMF